MSTRVTTPFSAQTTADEILRDVDLAGQRIIVTGGASGIGVETARSLVAAGAEVTLAVRNTAAGDETAREITGQTGGKQVLVAHLDLADQASVRSFANGWDGPLHVLVNNAGVMAAPLTRTPEGWEMQFGTNHLGHFALATALHRSLAAAGSARVVSVSSSAHLRAGVDFDDIHFSRRDYDPWIAYGQSKSANVLFAVEGTRRWRDDGIAVNALHPGGIRTRLQRYVSDGELDRMRAAVSSEPPAWKTPQQGAATSVLLAASPLLAGVSGRYFEDCDEAEPNLPGSRHGVAAHALDPEAAARLWQVSADTIGA